MKRVISLHVCVCVSLWSVSIENPRGISLGIRQAQVSLYQLLFFSSRDYE